MAINRLQVNMADILAGSRTELICPYCFKEHRQTRWLFVERNDGDSIELRCHRHKVLSDPSCKLSRAGFVCRSTAVPAIVHPQYGYKFLLMTKDESNNVRERAAGRQLNVIKCGVMPEMRQDSILC